MFRIDIQDGDVGRISDFQISNIQSQHLRRPLREFRDQMRQREHLFVIQLRAADRERGFKTDDDMVAEAKN